MKTTKDSIHAYRRRLTDRLIGLFVKHSGDTGAIALPEAWDIRVQNSIQSHVADQKKMAFLVRMADEEYRDSEPWRMPIDRPTDVDELKAYWGNYDWSALDRRRG